MMRVGTTIDDVSPENSKAIENNVISWFEQNASYLVVKRKTSTQTHEVFEATQGQMTKQTQDEFCETYPGTVFNSNEIHVKRRLIYKKVDENNYFRLLIILISLFAMGICVYFF